MSRRVPSVWAVRWPSVLAFALAVGCAGDEQKPDPAPTAANEALPGVVLPPIEGAAGAGDPPPAAPLTPPAPTTADGIDDENWLPKPGSSARDKFDKATAQLRTDPAGAAGRFIEAAGESKYFYAAWFNAGAAAEAAGDAGAAERHYRTALTVRPDFGPALANLVQLLTRSGRAADAQKLVDDTLKRFPDRAGPHLAAATLASLKKDNATTEREALAALKIDERSVPAMRLMAAVFRGQGRLDTAKFALENALAVEPGNAMLHLELGHVQLDQLDDKGALVSYEKAARLRPELVEAQENYGVLLLKQGFAAEALAAFDAAARLLPKSGRAQLHVGNGYRATKQYEKAEQAYKKALELEPALHDAHFNLALLYIDNPVGSLEELARWQKAIVELRAFKESAKPDGQLLARVEEYIDATDKRIIKEVKRREREERRKKDDAAASATPAPAAAGGGGGGSGAPK